MKLLLVTPPLQTENAGGIQASGRMAWDALRAQHDAVLLEIDARRRLPAVSAVLRVNRKPDVILFWHRDLLPLAQLLPRARRVVFLHGIEAWRRPGLLTRRLVRDAVLLANSHYTLQHARRWLPDGAVQRAQIVPLGWGEPAGFERAPADVPIAVMIGRLDSSERYKGHHEVIAAWPHVLARQPNAQLFIVGDGDLRPELEAHAESMNVAGAVRFFGRLDESEKERLLARARCLVLPSRAEGFGMVYLEAMRLGRPCITGHDGGAEVVGPAAGMQVDPADMPQLTAALLSLLSLNDQWHVRSAAARARYETMFTAQHFGARLNRALQQIS